MKGNCGEIITVTDVFLNDTLDAWSVRTVPD